MEGSESGGTFPGHQPMLTFEFTLGPLRIYFNLGDAPTNDSPDVEYIPAAQVERAEPYVSDRAPIEDRRTGFRA